MGVAAHTNCARLQSACIKVDSALSEITFQIFIRSCSLDHIFEVHVRTSSKISFNPSQDEYVPNSENFS